MSKAENKKWITALIANNYMSVKKKVDAIIAFNEIQFKERVNEITDDEIKALSQKQDYFERSSAEKFGKLLGIKWFKEHLLKQ